MRLIETERKVIGQRFGRLVAQSLVTPRVKKTKAICVCDCGNTTTAQTDNLLNGNTRSCGCLVVDSIVSRSTIHGGSHTKAFKLWSSIRQRCYDKNSTSFNRYGARGIKMCRKWRHSFKAFYRDMGDPPPGMSIERINNNGPYSPDNCKWATRIEQGSNKRNNVIVKINGESKTLSEWARIKGCKMQTLRNRIVNLGWSKESAITTPVRKCKGNLRYD